MSILDPNKFNCSTYQTELLKHNYARVLATQERLEDVNFSESVSSIVNILGGQGKNIKVYPMLVGSDGRLEKGAHSPDDLMIYIAGSELSPEILAPLSGWLTENFPLHNSTGIEQVEPKLLDLSLLYFYEDRSNPRPGRILDAREVNPDDFDASELTKLRLYDELISIENGIQPFQKVINKENERRTSARKLVARGQQTARGQVLVHVDYTTGTAFFDGKRGEGVFAVSSFKQGFLRLMQEELLHTILLHASQLDRNEARSFIRKIPSNTFERIDYLVDWEVFNQKIISARQIAELKDNYAFFMHQYHRSEYAYVTHKQSAVDFNKAEVSNRKEDVLAFDAALGRQFSKLSRKSIK